jgi:hypothetical protein
VNACLWRHSLRLPKGKAGTAVELVRSSWKLVEDCYAHKAGEPLPLLGVEQRARSVDVLVPRAVRVNVLSDAILGARR